MCIGRNKLIKKAERKRERGMISVDRVGCGERQTYISKGGNWVNVSCLFIVKYTRHGMLSFAHAHTENRVWGRRLKIKRPFSRRQLHFLLFLISPLRAAATKFIFVKIYLIPFATNEKKKEEKNCFLVTPTPTPTPFYHLRYVHSDMQNAIDENTYTISHNWQ